MTTYVSFVLSTTTSFQFQATFDSNEYTVVVTWNLYSQRYYINIYDLSGTLIVSQPMSGSPAGYDLSLTAGYFTTKLIWRASDGRFEIVG